MKKFDFFVKEGLIVVILCVYLIGNTTMNGCGDDVKGQKPDSNENGGNPYCKIKAIEPRHLPYSGDSFDVTVKAGFGGKNEYQDFKIDIYRTPDTCLAFRTLSISIKNNTTKIVPLTTTNFYGWLGCQTPNRNYKVFAYLVNGQEYNSTDYIEWGSANDSLLEPGLVFRKMYSNDFGEYTDMISSISSSFNNSNDDSDLVNVLPDYWKGSNSTTDSNFVRGDTLLQYLIARLHNYVDAYRGTYDTIAFPFYLNYARLFIFHNPRLEPPRYDTTILGLSINGKSGFPGINAYLYNFSFVFNTNIKHIYQFYPYNQHWQSVYNYVGVHELLHQMGNSLGANDHFYHTGLYKNRCALNIPDTFTTPEFTQNTSFYRVCDYHIVKFRNNIISKSDIKTIAAFKDENENKGKYADDTEIKLDISLPKNTYKLYEPILAKCKLINNSSDTIRLYSEFDEQLGEMNIIAKDKNGKIYNDNKLSEIFTRSFRLNGANIIVNPNETLYVSMKINNWGEQVQLFELEGRKLIPKTDNNSYFGQTGYYPVGEYNVFIELPNVRNIKSNEVLFKVQELNTDDMIFLKLVKGGKIDEAIALYPENSFVEHSTAQKIAYLIKKASMNELQDEDKQTLINLYKNIFEKYPETAYLNESNFLYPLIKALKENYKVGEVKEQITSLIDNVTLKKYLSNSITSRYIEKILNTK